MRRIKQLIFWVLLLSVSAANGTIERKTDANGQVKSHQYDALNRLIATDYSNPRVSVNRDVVSVAREYDGNNNEIKITETYLPNEIREDSRTYDDFDRLFNRTDSFDKTIRYRYDLNGNRIGLTDSDGIITNYTYDGLNRIATVTTTRGITNYQYDRSSLIEQINYPNNTDARYQYDQAKRIVEIHNQQNNATVSRYHYTFDENGNRTEQLEENGGAQEQTSYHYDNNDRLTNVHYNIGGGSDTEVSYAYDDAYNRISEVETTNAAQTKNRVYAYNQRNQLTDIQDALESLNNTHYQFDQNGNQTQKQKGADTSLYAYDIRDDLRQVTIGGSTVGQFLYDYQGLRIEKLGERGLERSTYDDQAILQQYNVQGCANVADAGCAGASNNANRTRAKFNYGPDRLLSLKTTGEPVQFYLTDALKSVVNLTNDQGAIQARYQYDAWGQKRNETGTSYNRFSFTGYEEDKETGLHYAKARYYDPDTGRFLGEDSWEGDNQIAPSLHKYLYAYQNPTVYVDPDGNQTVADSLFRNLTILQQNEDAEQAIQKIDKNTRFDAGVATGIMLDAPMETAKSLAQLAVDPIGSGAAIAKGAISGIGNTIRTGGQNITDGVQQFDSNLNKQYESDPFNAGRTVGKIEGEVLGTLFGGGAGSGKFLKNKFGATGQNAKVVGESVNQLTVRTRTQNVPERFVYRGINSKQEVAAANGKAIPPKNRNNPHTKQEHVSNGRLNTQFTSTTKKQKTAEFYAKGRNGYPDSSIIRIDLNKVKPSKIEDISDGGNLVGKARKWARKDKEVLIRGDIPEGSYEILKKKVE